MFIKVLSATVVVVTVLLALPGCSVRERPEQELSATQKIQIVQKMHDDAILGRFKLTAQQIETCLAFMSDPDPQVTLLTSIALAWGARHEKGKVVPVLMETLKRESEPFTPAGISMAIIMVDPDALHSMEKEMESVKETNPLGYEQFRRSIPFLKNGAENVRKKRPFVYGWKDSNQ